MTTMELINRGIGHNCLSDAYDLGIADERTRILELADCEDKDCWDCPFGRAEGCILKEKKNE